MKKIIFILFVLLVAVTGWCACRNPSPPYSFTASHTILYCSSTTVQRCAQYCDQEITFPSNYVKTGSFKSGSCGGLSLSSCTCQIGVCSGYTQQTNGACVEGFLCDTQSEADSIRCILNGDRWVDVGNGVKECKTGQCDTTFTCISYPYNYCEDVPSSDEITCVNGNCYGLGGSKWVSYYDKNCTNECGATENTRVSGDTVYVPGGSCDDPLQCDPTTHCADFDNGNYFLYQLCLVGREVVGNVDERQTMAQITLSGTGTCKDNGYRSETFP